MELKQQSSGPIDLPQGSSKDTPSIVLPDGPLCATRSILPGGVRLITQQVPGTRAATVGLWVATGSRDETRQQAGASHFLEHLLFKGTLRRSAFEIAEAFDRVGGESNAATSKETTHYWAKTLDADSAMSVETLTDMVTSSLLAEEDVETERTVIIDELAMTEDSPTDVVHEAFSRALFGDAPLGRPIGGTTASIEEVSADSIRELYREHYHSGNLIVAAAGNLNHNQLEDQLTAALERSSWPLDPSTGTHQRQLAVGGEGEPPLEVVIGREVEQAHILTGGTWLDATDEMRPASNVLLTVLGGGMSSRLFQEIRERRGLAYTTYAFDSAYLDAGYFGLYAGCAPENVEEVEKIIWDQVEKLAAGDVTDDELLRAKGQLRGGLALGLEDSAARMGRLGRSEIIGRFTSVDVALQRIENVTKDDITQLAGSMLSRPRARALVTSK